MKIIYEADDGTQHATQEACEKYEADNDIRAKVAEAERARRASEDFRFMVLCAAKGNMGMYDLFRDRSLK